MASTKNWWSKAFLYKEIIKINNMPTKVMSVSPTGRIRRTTASKVTSTYSRTQELLKALGISPKEHANNIKWEVACNQVKQLQCQHMI
jgi:hypothetical protein